MADANNDNAPSTEGGPDDGIVPETQFNSNPPPPPPFDLANGHATELEAERAISLTPESQMQQKQQQQQQQQQQMDGQRDKDLLPSSPPTVGAPADFDWDDFERRFEQALSAADEKEKAILREAGELAQYFRAWASAASAHDDERAAKRLQTRKRHVNMREGQMEEKQKHYEEVVKAFESALALLQS